jgi:hypothetical protein
MLKAEYASKDEVPAAHAELYSERGGKWVLSGIEGVKTQADVDALSTVVRKEREARAEMERKAKRFEALGDRDPDDLLKALDELEHLREGAGGKDDEAALQRKLAREINPLKRDLEKANARAQKAEADLANVVAQLKRNTVERALQEAALAAKVRPEAIADILRHQDEFEIDGDKVRTRNGLEPDVWLSDLKNTRPHYWPGSVGGGASGASGSGVANGGGFAKDRLNLTEMSRMMAKDPAKADQMAQQAGFKNAAAAITAKAEADAKTFGRR